MKKTTVAAVGIVVVLVAGYAGATAWSGQRTEARHHEYLERLQAQAPFLKLTEQTYRKGFASASSSSTFEIGCATADGKVPTRLVLAETIHHGPFAGGTVAAAVIDAQLGLSGAGSERTMAMFAGAPLSAHTVVDFSGKATSTVSGAAAKIALPEGAEIAWQGLSGTVELGGDMRAFSYHMKSPGVTVADAATGLSLRMAGLDVQAAGSFLSGSSHLAIGKDQGSVDAVEMSMAMPAAGAAAARPVSISFTGLEFASDSSIAGELIRLTSTLGGAAVFNGARVDRFEMQGSMKNLHAPTYLKIMERLSTLTGCEQPAASAAPAKLLGDLQADVMALARHNPEVALDKLVIDHGDRHGELSYSLALQGVTAADAQLPPMALLMTRGRARATMRMPVAWIRQLSQEGSSRMQGAVPGPEVVDAMVDSAVAEGYLVRDGDDVRSSVDFTAGVMTINGKALPSGGKRP